VPDGAPVGELPARIDEHVPRRRERRHLPVVERRDAAIRLADHHVPAATKIPRLRIGDREREADGDRRVHRIPATAENLHAGLRRDRAVARDHRLRR
jgi:hypothetical protein